MFNNTKRLYTGFFRMVRQVYKAVPIFDMKDTIYNAIKGYELSFEFNENGTVSIKISVEGIKEHVTDVPALDEEKAAEE